jgi:hypothetical protein
MTGWRFSIRAPLARREPIRIGNCGVRVHPSRRAGRSRLSLILFVPDEANAAVHRGALLDDPRRRIIQRAVLDCTRRRRDRSSGLVSIDDAVSRRSSGNALCQIDE